MKQFTKISSTYYKTRCGTMPPNRYLIRKYWEDNHAELVEAFTWTGVNWQPVPYEELLKKYDIEMGYQPAIICEDETDHKIRHFLDNVRKTLPLNDYIDFLESMFTIYGNLYRTQRDFQLAINCYTEAKRLRRQFNERVKNY